MVQPLELLGKKEVRPTHNRIRLKSTAAPQILEANQARSSQTDLGRNMENLLQKAFKRMQVHSQFIESEGMGFTHVFGGSGKNS